MEIIGKRGPENIQEDDDYQAELEKERERRRIEEENKKREDRKENLFDKMSKLLEDMGWI